MESYFEGKVRIGVTTKSEMDSINAKVEDAEELTDIWNKTIRETKYLSRGDRDGYFDKEDALENINDYLDSDKVVYLVAMKIYIKQEALWSIFY